MCMGGGDHVIAIGNEFSKFSLHQCTNIHMYLLHSLGCHYYHYPMHIPYRTDSAIQIFSLIKHKNAIKKISRMFSHCHTYLSWEFVVTLKQIYIIFAIKFSLFKLH